MSHRISRVAFDRLDDVKNDIVLSGGSLSFPNGTVLGRHNFLGRTGIFLK